MIQDAVYSGSLMKPPGSGGCAEGGKSAGPLIGGGGSSGHWVAIWVVGASCPSVNCRQLNAWIERLMIAGAIFSE